MAAYVFDKVLSQGVRAGQIPARTTAARNWYRDAAQKVGSVSPSTLIRKNSAKFVDGFPVGSMVLFQYDPKLKKTLPYYDEFPLVFPIGPAAGGFLGLNMHYLPLQQRAALMDALYKLATDTRYDEGTRLKLSYKILSASAKYKWFKPCVKHYLTEHVRSRTIQIDSVEWDIALFLPLQRFKKASSTKVYQHSLGMV